MKRKILALILVHIFSIGMLAGCGHEHEFSAATCTTPATCVKCNETEGEALGHTWTDATCTAPKTCSVCNETEGEALGHTLSAANYQQPATCSICAKTEGEFLTPAFIEHQVQGTFMQIGTVYNYITDCYDNPNYKTVGKLMVTDYQTFASDDTHEAKEGYEWKIVQLQLVFDDVNAWDYGWTYRSVDDDYYDIIGFEDSMVVDDNGVGTFTVNWNGQEYTECMARVTSTDSGWQDRTYTRIATWEHLLPVGYNGTIICAYDAANNKEDGMYLYEVTDANSLFFRLY